MIANNDLQPLPPRKPRFLLGNRVATPGAIRAMEDAGQDAMELFARHQAGDWGDVCAEDAQANETAINEGSRIMSVYTLRTGVKIWIITEANRAATTALFPTEY